MADRGVRSLCHLDKGASTARVLNLLFTWRRYKDTPEYTQKPFFQNSRLNRTMILKHRLRRDEVEQFETPCVVATKVVFPVDSNDLRFGGRSVFIGERNFAEKITELVGEYDAFEALDLPLLKLLDSPPSFDPSLLREELARGGYKPAACYLTLSEADLKRIFAFVQTEIEPLTRMSLGGQAGLASQTTKLAAKILSHDLDNDMQPLRRVLNLSESEFAEGVFCWKGFLYYKWVYSNVEGGLKNLIATIMQIKPAGKLDSDAHATIERVRGLLADRIISSKRSIAELLSLYDDAYAELTQKGNPIRFREFLLSAPQHFAELGERLGALQHVMSFCTFRFPQKFRAPIPPEELMDIFNDFESALYLSEENVEQQSAVA